MVAVIKSLIDDLEGTVVAINSPLEDLEMTLLPSLLLAKSDEKKTHLTENHGLVTILPHLISVTRAGVAATVVTSKAIAVDLIKKKSPYLKEH